MPVNSLQKQVAGTTRRFTKGHSGSRDGRPPGVRSGATC
jgi:hypothetical protein